MEKETNGERIQWRKKPLVTLNLLDTPMEKASKEDKSKAIDESLNEEEYSAALCLASLKHTKLDEETAARLDDMKRKTLRRINGKDVQEEAPKILGRINGKDVQEEAPKILGRIKRKNIQEEAPRIQQESNSVIERPVLLQNGLMLDGYEPPNRPPIAAIQSIIGECSRPCRKLLTETDLKDHQTRLSLIKNQVQESFIPLLKEDENVSSGIQVITYDKDGKEYPMTFKFWTCKMYVLTAKGWKRFYTEHGLQPKVDEVTVWMFRHKMTQKLCCAITWRTRS